MDGSAPDAWMAEVNKAFEAKHPGVKVKVEKQIWNGIQEKVTTALSEDTPPDVLELGNTQTAGYAVTGGLADLTGDKATLGYDGWNKGMLASSELDGKLYSARGTPPAVSSSTTRPPSRRPVSPRRRPAPSGSTV